MSYFQTGELAALRTEYALSFDRTCTVPGTRTVTNAGDGTWSEGTADDVALVPCSFMAAAGNERVVGGAVAQIGNYVMRFAWNLSLTPRMTIAVDAHADGRPAKTFQLVAPLDEAFMVGQRWLATEGG